VWSQCNWATPSTWHNLTCLCLRTRFVEDVFIFPLRFDNFYQHPTKTYHVHRMCQRWDIAIRFSWLQSVGIGNTAAFSVLELPTLLEGDHTHDDILLVTCRSEMTYARTCWPCNWSVSWTVCGCSTALTSRSSPSSASQRQPRKVSFYLLLSAVVLTGVVYSVSLWRIRIYFKMQYCVKSS